MKKILKLKKLLISLTIGLIVLGINSFYNIPKQENPDLGSLHTTITIEAVGKSSEEIDTEIIDKVNTVISNIDGIGETMSYAYDNFGMIIVVYDIGLSSVDDVELKLNADVNNMNFEEDVKLTVTPHQGISDILYVFPVKDIDKAYEFQSDLYELDTIKNVTISDITKPYFQVNLDNNKLIQYGMDSTVINQLISSKGISSTLGLVEGSPVITTNNFESIEELNSLVVAQNESGLITLDMLGAVNEVSDKNYSNLYNGEDSLFMSVQFNKNIDITKLGDDIKDIAKAYPTFKTISFSPDYVDDAINEINTTLLIGMVLVVIVSVMSLGFRSALTIIITFPLTIFSTVLFLHLLNVPLQNISIAGLIISIGIIVDNAIVVVDAIIHELENGNEMETSIISAIKKNFTPVFTSTLTTVVAFTPLLFLPGVAGKMASSLPLTVIIALICSFLSAIFIIPIIASKVLKPRNRKNMDVFDKVIKASLRFPKLNIVFVIVMLVASLGAVYTMQPVQLFPTAEKNYIYIDYEVGNTNDINEVLKVQEQIEDHIDSKDVVSSINYTIPTFYTSLIQNFATPNTGRILYVNEGDNRKEIARMKKELKKELDSSVVYNVEEIMMNSPGAPIQISLYDLDKTEEVVEELKKIEGVEFVQATTTSFKDQYNIVPKQEVLAKEQINEALIYAEVARLINDQSIDVVDNGNVENDLVISNNIKDMEQLLNQSVRINNKAYLLKDIVDIETISSPVVVTRKDYKVSNTIDVYIDNRHGVYEIHNQTTEILDNANASYSINGEKELTTQVFTDVVYAGAAALLLILLILLAQFDSFKKILIILASIVFSLIGSALFILIFDQPITFTASLGLVSLMGIVVNNGILLVDYINKSEEDNLYDQCFNSVKRRSRPIITSNVTTIIGLIPLIIFGSDFFRPMAITLVGGLIVAIPLSLCVIPSLYLVLNKEKKNNK